MGQYDITLQATDLPIGSTQMLRTAEKCSIYLLDCNSFFFLFFFTAFYFLCFSLHQMFSKGDASDKSSNVWQSAIDQWSQSG